ncbi:hypothetical protein DVK02_15950, partial [Halobellus sp. Atlit-31R]
YILACPRKSDWHWPSFYLLYVDVDRLAMALMRTEHFFGPPLFEGSPAPTGEELLEASRAVLGEVGKHQRAIFGWLYPMSRRIVRDDSNAVVHARLYAHLHPKSGWCQAFLSHYDAGALSGDGQRLVRTVLPILTEPPYERPGYGDFTLRHQSFEAHTPEALAALAAATRHAAQALGRISARMSACLLAHCRIDDLLHPCSH